MSVLFVDLVGYTSLTESWDPSDVRELLSHYFDVTRAIVDRYGGTIEKFIGDAVMAVFGVPVLHEDDALRACRAAVEMRDAVPEF
ncbi:MAG: adenylate/guanylate cyclase domain-containing protein, partial [Solirubrobacteraceae bacterium]